MGHLRAMVEAELFSLSRRDIMGRRDQPSLDILNRLPNLIAKKVQGTGFPAGFAFRREQRLCWLRSERQDRAHQRRAPTAQHRNTPSEKVSSTAVAASCASALVVRIPPIPEFIIAE